MAILFADTRFLQHNTGNHPESAQRLASIYARLEDSSLWQRFDRGAIQPASYEQLARVHAADHIEHVRQFAERGGGQIDADTVVGPRSYDVAKCAAGVALTAVDQVVGSLHQQAVCLARPPGHHALRARSMGFCLFNNVAVAACHAQAVHGLSRILIVDWDVHHGNGTQEIFFESGEVYFFSAHRYPFYPRTGTEDETGSGAGLGTIFNLPIRFGTSRREYLERFEIKLQQAAARCRPELVLISAGYDAHAADPIGSLGLESEDFARLTEMVRDVAGQYCDGRIVSLLEGGYNLNALAESVVCHLETLVPREPQ